mgnify:CR=1 FL=1
MGAGGACCSSSQRSGVDASGVSMTWQTIAVIALMAVSTAVGYVARGYKADMGNGQFAKDRSCCTGDARKKRL